MERTFRLAGLLRLRRLQQDQAAGRLAVAHARLRSAEAQRDGTQAALANHTMPDGGGPAWSAAVLGRETLGVLLDEAATQVEGAHHGVQAYTDEWSRARSRSVGLEKLEDKHALVVRYEDDRAEQIVLDEIAARGAGGRAPKMSERNSA